MEESYIKGCVLATYYENSTNYYKVLLVAVDDTNTDIALDQIVVTGTFGQMHQETEYTFYGQIVEHHKYGVQFQVSRYEQEVITSEKGLIYYFSSNRFPGIGTVLATRIVDALGSRAIDYIVEDSPLLQTISGLTASKRSMLIEQVKQDRGENQTVLELLKYGFTDKEALKIYQRYQDSAKQVIESNPYCLLDMIDGVGFYKIDQLALSLGFVANSAERLQAALVYVVKELSFRYAYTWFDPKTIIMNAIKLLEQSHKVMVDEVLMVQMLSGCAMVGALIYELEKVSLPSLYYAEQSIASRVKAIANQEEISYPKQDLNQVIKTVQKQLSVTYSQQQVDAIKKALRSPISILTGGPGTGKTTVLKGLVASFALLNDIDLSRVSQFDSPILLAAPTGRAAKRMSQLIGLQSVTLHRLLGIGLTGQSDQTDDYHDLEGLLLIVDEVSMVDTFLMNWLLKAVPMGMQVVFVGDKDQLPSVGPGKVLSDMLESNILPFTQLTTIFRQAEQSTIIQLAHRVNKGELPTDFTVNQKDRSFLPCATNQVPLFVETVVKRALNKGYTIQDIQVLAPMYKGVAGIDALNQIIQEAVNPPHVQKQELHYFDKVFRVGDKVLQQVNVPEKSVYNGDIGYIEAIVTDNQTQEIIVRFDEQIEVSYTTNEFNQLTLAYCCSIHKAQGSEFPLVILPLVTAYSRMLRRDLLYTALTRSKDIIVFCGELDAFSLACSQKGDDRNTRLLACLREDGALSSKIEVTNDRVNKNNDTFVLTLENIEHIDAMIGMDNITPYQFMKGMS